MITLHKLIAKIRYHRRKPYIDDIAPDIHNAVSFIRNGNMSPIKSIKFRIWVTKTINEIAADYHRKIR